MKKTLFLFGWSILLLTSCKKDTEDLNGEKTAACQASSNREAGEPCVFPEVR